MHAHNNRMPKMSLQAASAGIIHGSKFVFVLSKSHLSIQFKSVLAVVDIVIYTTQKKIVDCIQSS